MSEDDIHGSPASRARFLREHPGWGDPHPHQGAARPAEHKSTIHRGGTPPLHHAPPKKKDAAIPTAHESKFTKKTCDLISLEAICQHDGRKAVKEKDGQYILSVVPHDGGLTTSGSTKTSQGFGTKPVQTDAQVRAEERRNEQRSQALEAEQQKLDKRDAKLQARKDLNTRNYRRTVSRLNRDQTAHQASRSEFIKDNRAKTHVGVDLYLEQGDPTVPDVMTFRAKMASQCGKHPAWELWDGQTNEQVATHDKPEWPTGALLPPTIDYSAMPSVLPKLGTGYNAYWLKGVKPRLYTVRLKTCAGAKVILVKVYPLVESGIDIVIEHEGSTNKPAHGSWAARIAESKAKFESIVETINSVTPPGGPKLTPKILPEGKFTLINKWVEEEKTNEVVWEADASLNATLITLTVSQPLIAGLPEIVMRAVRHVADAGINIKLNLEASANVTCKWKQAPEQETHFTFEPNSGVKGEVSLGVEAHFKVSVPVIGDDVLAVSGEAKTVAELSATVEPTSEGGVDKVSLDVKGQWKHPLVFIGSVTFLTRRPRTVSKDMFGAMPEHKFGVIPLW